LNLGCTSTNGGSNHKTSQIKTIKLKGHYKADAADISDASVDKTFTDEAMLKSNNQYTL